MAKKKNPAPQKYTEVICVRLGADVYKRIKVDAAAKDLTMTQLVRVCIREHYERAAKGAA